MEENAWFAPYQPRFDNPANRKLKSLYPPEDEDMFLQRYQMTQKQREAVSQLPQGSEGWKTFVWWDPVEEKAYEPHLKPSHCSRMTKLYTRWGRITGSIAGNFAGMGYQTIEEATLDMLDGTFQGNQFTRYGNEHEDHAAELSRVALQQGYHPAIYLPGNRGDERDALWLEQCSLVLHPDYPFLGYSADGIWHLPGSGSVLNEIKCPQNVYPRTPPPHYCQVTLGCAILSLNEISYNVYLPQALFMHRYKFDEPFWEQYLLPALKDAFYNYLLPRLILRDKGLLLPGELFPLANRIPRSLREKELPAGKPSKVLTVKLDHLLPPHVLHAQHKEDGPAKSEQDALEPSTSPITAYHLVRLFLNE